MQVAQRRKTIADELVNPPNLLTLFRIALIPVFVWLTYDADPWASFVAALVLSVASVTDIIDGVLARRMNLITVTGKLLDPLADKLLTMAAMVMMSTLSRMPAWLVIINVSRELLVSGLRQIAAAEGMVIAAGQEGKWKTSSQLVGLICLCIHYEHLIDFGVLQAPVNFNRVGLALVGVSTLFSVKSAVSYFNGFFAAIEASSTESSR